jgi:hypothetical protein
MINYVHCHIGQMPPDYLIDSFESIYSVDPEARIIFITDQDIEIDGVEVLRVNDIACDQTLKTMDMSLFRNDPNQLWRTSIFRVFLVRDAMKYLNLEYCYHFDSDVLMFQSSKVFEHLINDFDGLYITYHNEFEVVFGFSRLGSFDKIDKICDILHDVVFDPAKQIEYSSAGMANEMRLMCGIMKRNPNLIKTLNILPNEKNIVFDPSSYGQYFGGTHQGHPPGFSHHTHDIGRGIQSGELVPVMVNKKPYVKMGDKEYPIINLHIHSKNTRPFLP